MSEMRTENAGNHVAENFRRRGRENGEYTLSERAIESDG
jgi:hypothetical protein